MHSLWDCEPDVRTGPVFISSGDLIADGRYKWALEHAARGDFEAASEILQQTLELAPRFATAWFALGAICDRMGDREAAVDALRQARDCDPQDYHGARLHLARLQAGEATPAMTAVYVRRLFDEHAPNFDKSLLEHLDYRGPAVLRETVAGVCREAGRPMRFAATLDLGCGTGLAGMEFRRCTDRLVGIDLSAGMVEQANLKGVYDRLDVADLLHALATESACEATAPGAVADDFVLPGFDLILAADVFVYVPDLAPVARAVARRLEPNGLFAFTVETYEGDAFVLGPALRYAHGAAHVRAALQGAGLLIDHFEPACCRTERGVPVGGLVVVARRVG
jgi:predicted TPR repeat methyltransferase